MGPTVRTFIAIAIRPEIREGLGRIAEEGRRTGGSVKWVDPALIHLTLRFLGDVEEARIPQVIDAMRQAAGAAVPFVLRVAGIGAFPNARRPRVIWAGAEEKGQVLRGLAASVEAACVRIGFGPSDHPFSPHVTIGRVKEPKDGDRVRAVIERHAKDELGTQTVDRVHLMRSELRPQGPLYTPVAEAPFATT